MRAHHALVAVLYLLCTRTAFGRDLSQYCTLDAHIDPNSGQQRCRLVAGPWIHTKDVIVPLGWISIDMQPSVDKGLGHRRIHHGRASEMLTKDRLRQGNGTATINIGFRKGVVVTLRNFTGMNHSQVGLQLEYTWPRDESVTRPIIDFTGARRAASHLNQQVAALQGQVAALEAEIKREVARLLDGRGSDSTVAALVARKKDSARQLEQLLKRTRVEYTAAPQRVDHFNLPPNRPTFIYGRTVTWTPLQPPEPELFSSETTDEAASTPVEVVRDGNETLFRLTDVPRARAPLQMSSLAVGRPESSLWLERPGVAAKFFAKIIKEPPTAQESRPTAGRDYSVFHNTNCNVSATHTWVPTYYRTARVCQCADLLTQCTNLTSVGLVEPCFHVLRLCGYPNLPRPIEATSSLTMASLSLDQIAAWKDLTEFTKERRLELALSLQNQWVNGKLCIRSLWYSGRHVVFQQRSGDLYICESKKNYGNRNWWSDLLVGTFHVNCSLMMHVKSVKTDLVFRAFSMPVPSLRGIAPQFTIKAGSKPDALDLVPSQHGTGPTIKDITVVEVFNYLYLPTIRVYS